MRERLVVARAPLARGGHVLVLDDHPDPAVPERDQMLDEAACAPAGAVAQDDVAIEPGIVRSIRTNGHAEPREPLQVRP